MPIPGLNIFGAMALGAVMARAFSFQTFREFGDKIIGKLKELIKTLKRII
ncbi:MAG TPA: hypothetical protein VIK84_07225 [Haloplasmataceae bacterium]